MKSIPNFVLMVILTVAAHAQSVRQLEWPQAKTTQTSTETDTMSWAQDIREFHIPVVVHVIYDFTPGQQSYWVSDSDIRTMVFEISSYYNKNNQQLASIIPTWQKWIGNAHISFDLANLDPSSKPTTGIIRKYSYLSRGGTESSKIDPWPVDHYLNIYLVDFLSSGSGIPPGNIILSHTDPQYDDQNPLSRGLLCRSLEVANINYSHDASVPSAMAQFLGLPLMASHYTGVSYCEDDGIDDTPPCLRNGSINNLYDTTCAGNYFKIYDSTNFFKRTGIKTHSGGIIDYPDTINAQNMMTNYGIESMFTQEQCHYMRETLRNSLGQRSNLVDSANLFQTGILNPGGHLAANVDLPVIPFFSVSKAFICADGSSSVNFVNRSYNDTVTSVNWSFSNSAATPTSSNFYQVSNTFQTPGWVTISLKCNGNNTTSKTISRSDMLYVADPNPVRDITRVQEFDTSGNVEQYPIFNYYGNDHKWQLVQNAGVYDKSSICYANFDTRTAIDQSTAPLTPVGTYADFFTPAFDLTNEVPGCIINFYTAGAYRTINPKKMQDTLFVDASNDCGNTWKKQGIIAGPQIGSNLSTVPFVPTNGQWVERGIPIGNNELGISPVYFRFRFKTGSNGDSVYNGQSFGAGNNFYIDRLRLTNDPLGVRSGITVNLGMELSPNPSSGSTFVTINGGDLSPAELQVMDMAGKLLYATHNPRTSQLCRIEIPASVFPAKGIYLVRVKTTGAIETRKLVIQ